jgi:hypothetical protein
VALFDGFHERKVHVTLLETSQVKGLVIVTNNWVRKKNREKKNKEKKKESQNLHTCAHETKTETSTQDLVNLTRKQTQTIASEKFGFVNRNNTNVGGSFNV